MSSNLWKRVAAATLVAGALAACGTKGEEAPAFATAEPVAAAKPDEFGFKNAIRVTALEGLKETVRRNLSVVLKTEEFSKSLSQSLANDEMLALEDAQAIYELTPIFVDLRTAPVNDDVTAAQAIVRYRVVRRDDGATVFDRQIKTEFTSIADPAFDGSGMFTRTLRLVGLKRTDPPPVTANRSGADGSKGPGPAGGTAREIHASRNAIALNIRLAMRHLIAEAPERVKPPLSMGAMPDSTQDGGGAVNRNAPPPETEEPETPKAETPEADGMGPLPPLAPEVETDSGD